eukprot:665608-Amphidinium_carterae.1
MMLALKIEGMLAPVANALTIDGMLAPVANSLDGMLDPVTNAVHSQLMASLTLSPMHSQLMACLTLDPASNALAGTPIPLAQLANACTASLTEDACLVGVEASAASTLE